MGGVEGVGEVDDGLDSAAEALHITVDRSAAMESPSALSVSSAVQKKRSSSGSIRPSTRAW